MPDVLVRPAGELRPHPPRRDPLEAVHQGGDGDLWRVFDQQVQVIVLAVEIPQLCAEVAAPSTSRPGTTRACPHRGHRAGASSRRPGEHGARKLPACNGGRREVSEATGMLWCCARQLPLPAYPGRVRQQDAGPDVQVLAGGVQRCAAGSGVRAPGRGEDLRHRGATPGVTLAKTTPERAWLGEVSSVALVQACQDARRAYRNWFDSLSGKRKGRKVGHPRFRSRKDQPAVDPARPQRVRPHGGRCLVAKVGDMSVSLVTASAVGAVVGHPHPRGRRPPLRVLRGRGAGHATPGVISDVGVDLGLTGLGAPSPGR